MKKRSYSLDGLKPKNLEENRSAMVYDYFKKINKELIDELEDLKKDKRIRQLELRRCSQDLEASRFKKEIKTGIKVLQQQVEIVEDKEQLNMEIKGLKNRNDELIMDIQQNRQLFKQRDETVSGLKQMLSIKEADMEKLLFFKEETRFKILTMEREIKTLSNNNDVAKSEYAKEIKLRKVGELEIEELKKSNVRLIAKDHELENNFKIIVKQLSIKDEQLENLIKNSTGLLFQVEEIAARNRLLVANEKELLESHALGVHQLNVSLNLLKLNTNDLEVKNGKLIMLLSQEKKLKDLLRIDLDSVLTELQMCKNELVFTQELKQREIIQIVEPIPVFEQLISPSADDVLLDKLADTEKIIAALKDDLSRKTRNEQLEIRKDILFAELRCACGNLLIKCFLLECGHSSCEKCGTICRICNLNSIVLCRNFKVEHLLANLNK